MASAHIVKVQVLLGVGLMTGALFDLLMSSILVLSDDAKETMFFVGDASGEKDSVAQREKIPQAIKLKWRAIRAHECLDEIAADRIVIIDQAIPEIADPKVAAFHEGKSPGSVEIAV